MKVDSKWRDLFHELTVQGWEVRPTNSNHIKLIPPDAAKRVVIVAGTPSDHRAFQNTRAACRRSGAAL